MDTIFRQNQSGETVSLKAVITALKKYLENRPYCGEE
jgi:hypothetical protein